jgi:hypothetical protein
MSQALKVLIPKLSPKDQAFAESLCKASNPSEKQLYWINELIKRATQPEPVKVTENISGILELINRNNNAKYPGFTVYAAGIYVGVSRASERARYPGTINVVRHEEARQNFGEYIGRIHLNGSFQIHKAVSSETAQKVIEALKIMVQDPEGTAKAYGQQTGHCCFCNLPLADERSLVAGYGPTCAKNYELKWGKE